MTTNVRVIHPRDFLRARADGRVDLETGKRLLEDLARAAQPLEHFEMLIDTRHVVGQLTAEDLYELAGSLVQFRGTFLHKTAVLCPRERFAHTRFFGMLAASHGFRDIRAFVTYEDAMEWLLEPAD